MHVLTMKMIWTACKRHEVMVKLAKYSLYIESRTLESGIQKVGIQNPNGWNPESKWLESGIQRPGSGIQRLGSGIQDLRGFPYMGRT